MNNKNTKHNQIHDFTFFLEREKVNASFAVFTVTFTPKLDFWRFFKVHPAKWRAWVLEG